MCWYIINGARQGGGGHKPVIANRGGFPLHEDNTRSSKGEPGRNKIYNRACVMDMCLCVCVCVCVCERES